MLQDRTLHPNQGQAAAAAAAAAVVVVVVAVVGVKLGMTGAVSDALLRNERTDHAYGGAGDGLPNAQLLQGWPGRCGAECLSPGWRWPT